MQAGVHREVTANRWTGLDQALQECAQNGIVGSREPDIGDDVASRPMTRLIGRLQHLEQLGLAENLDAGHWRLRAEMEPRSAHWVSVGTS